MVTAFNKKTFEWKTVVDPTLLGDLHDWVIDPVFEDETNANAIPPRYWIFQGNVIKHQSDTELHTNPVLLADAKHDIHCKLKQHFNGVLYGIMEFGEHGYTVDQDSRRMISLFSEFADKALSQGVEWPSDLMWKDDDGSVQLFSIEDIAKLQLTIFDYTTKCYKVYWNHVDAINALTVYSDIINYDVTTGWPEKYGTDYTTPTSSHALWNSRKQKTQLVTMSTENTPYTQRKTPIYVTIVAIPYLGHAISGFYTSIKVIASVTAGTGSIRIYDTTNDVILVEKEITNTSPQIIDLGPIAELSMDEAVHEIQVKSQNTIMGINIYSVKFIY